MIKAFCQSQLLLASLSLGALTSPQVTEAAEDKPNLILVVLDDLDWLHTGPHLKEFMPFLSQKTAQDGVRIDAAHSAAICCEARAAILTGLYAHNNGVFTNGGTWGGYEAFRAPKDGAGLVKLDSQGLPIDNEDRSIARALELAGYETGIYGKYLNGFERRGDELPKPPKSWHRGSVYVDPLLRSYLGYGYELLNWSPSGADAESFGYLPRDYATDVLTDKALEFLQEKSPAPKFLYLTYTRSPLAYSTRSSSPSRSLENPALLSRHPQYLSGWE